jgi:hypothetical protein
MCNDHGNEIPYDDYRAAFSYGIGIALIHHLAPQTLRASL